MIPDCWCVAVGVDFCFRACVCVRVPSPHTHPTTSKSGQERLVIQTGGPTRCLGPCSGCNEMHEPFCTHVHRHGARCRHV